MELLKLINFKILFYLLIFNFICNLYRVVISIFAFKKPIRDYDLDEDKYSFLFLIPACNEEKVIKESLKYLERLNYNKDLYEVCVLVNNSEDNTYKIAKKSKFKVLDIKFNQNDPKGKPHVLKKFFEQNIFWKNYTYIAILDADNIISENFLKEINSQIISKKRMNLDVTVIQGYLGIKNPLETFNSAGYGGAYFIANRIYQYAKYRLGFNAAIGGTGFVIETDYIVNNGWKPITYTEDFELQVELSIKDKRVYWNHFAEIYDEKPLTLRQSIRQRNRWAQGHWRVAITTTFKQLISIFNVSSIDRLGSKLDCLIYSYSMTRPLVLLYLLVNFCVFGFGLPKYLKVEIISTIQFWVIMSIYAYFIMPLHALLKEGEYLYFKDKWKKIAFLYFASYYAGLTYFISQVIGFFTFFKKQNNWAKTEHSHNYENIE